MVRSRIEDLIRFYDLLRRLKGVCACERTLDSCHGRLDWPQRGIYFFFEEREVRSDSGAGPRVVRVGTHALKTGSRTKLWNRLSQHRGNASNGGGNHRGSIFRLIVGRALMLRDANIFPTWGVGASATRDIRDDEIELERIVSRVIGRMPFLWLNIPDAPGPESERGFIERNAIALLSNSSKTPIDMPAQQWLGHHSDRARVRASGLWNSNHVEEAYDPSFLDRLEVLIAEMGEQT
jgi:hypothetical protein